MLQMQTLSIAQKYKPVQRKRCSVALQIAQWDFIANIVTFANRQCRFHVERSFEYCVTIDLISPLAEQEEDSQGLDDVGHIELDEESAMDGNDEKAASDSIE